MYEEKLKRKPNNFWTEEAISRDLLSVIETLKHFPSQRELKEIGRIDLLSAMKKNKGIEHFRRVLGYELSQKSRGYWTDETITSELKAMISNLGHFPSHIELKEMKRSDLSNAISNHKGVNFYREQLGFESLQRTKGYWNEAKIISELKEISRKIGHFPTRNELLGLKRNDLAAAIDRHASFIKFRIILKYEIYNAGVKT